jgi:hypothetical protein
VPLLVEVRTAPWVEVNRIEALIDGELAAVRRVVRRSGGETTPPLRWRSNLVVPPRDSTIVVVVRGDEPLTRAGVPTKPFAFTNPIYVDADGDGAWTSGSELSPTDAGAPPDSGRPAPAASAPAMKE